jgi:hypothetical protein
MDEQSTGATPENPVTGAPDQPTPTTDQPPAAAESAGQLTAEAPPSPWQPGTPTADLPQSAWQPTPPPAGLPQGAWQPGTPANLPQNPWQPTAPPAAWQPQQAWPDPGPWHPPLKTDAGLPPSWHAPLRTDLIPLPQPRKRRRKRVVLIAAAVVVLLIAGVTTWLAWPPDRSPFEQAVASLAAQRVVNYKAELPDGSTFDGHVTDHGDAVGTLTGDDERFPFTIVNGKLWVRLNGKTPPPGTAPNLDTNLLSNRWITGDVGVLAPLRQQAATPGTIADQLRREVAATPKLPTPSDEGTTINNLPVLKADTPNGTLYVAKQEPYRVLRWVDKGTKKSQAAFTDPGRKLRLNGGQGGYSGMGTVDFTPVTANDVDQTYDDLETDVGQLGNAVDTSVSFTVDQFDNLDHYNDCEAAGCAVTAHVTATPMSGGPVPAEVTVSFTSTVTIDDIPAGSCTGTAKVPSRGAGTLSCVDTDIHTGYKQADDNASAAAEAKAGDAPIVYYWLTVKANLDPFIPATVDTVAEGKRLESLRPDHACGWTDKGGTGKTAIGLYDSFDGRLDTARFPDFEIHVFQNGEPYGEFGPSGWFAKPGGVAVPAGPPAQLNDLLKNAAVAFMKANGTLKDGDDISGDKWKRPASHC